MVKRVLGKLRWVYKTHIEKDPSYVALNSWYKARGDETLRLDYPLNDGSIVFDVGGYQGVWASQIAARFDSHIFIFEPIPDHFNVIQARFSLNQKVRAYNFGLSGKTESQTISMLEDGSSVFRSGGSGSILVNLFDVAEFIHSVNIDEIDLIKINIEGGEYQLLSRMIETGIVKRCRDIQVQFHNFYPQAEVLREEIRMRLKKTHYVTYDFPFVWENWRRI